jgi:hypothetical protein
LPHVLQRVKTMGELWTLPKYRTKFKYCLILKPFFLGMPPPWGFTLHLKSRCNMPLLFLEGYSWIWGIQEFEYTRIFQSDLWIGDVLLWSHLVGIGRVFLSCLTCVWLFAFVTCLEDKYVTICFDHIYILFLVGVKILCKNNFWEFSHSFLVTKIYLWR